ncbi:GTP cyclohydrolase II [Emcibacter nanhaiensis]|uniref:GTP cyclohydrolase-2 n=1 Tax=Emcibacter nanhaiensis TaxID=1505037 RepID=A0A501PFH1_9PROT|nr:GTP cyclohydrolase II [Emcibacter nanhaiensis]TPD59180.1 GTP cyclohydrolase II [Emcibacter nanhaiensis]
MTFDHKIVNVERAASELRRGRPVVVTNSDEELLVFPPELLTEQWLDSLKAAAGGKLQVGLTYNRANVLKVSPRKGDVALVDVSRHMTSAAIQFMVDPADDLDHPMMGPYKVAAENAGPMHDAGIKLCKIARLLPAAVFVGPVPKGRFGDLLNVSAGEVTDYDLSDALSLEKVTSAKVPLEGAEDTEIVAFRPKDGGTEHFAILIGSPNRHDPVLARIHSECFTGDLLGSLKCDCGDQMRGAIKFMREQGGGVLLYLAQEGRGIGLINKLRAYHLQDQGFDTVDANERLGFLSDERIFEPAAQMLKKLGFSKVRLLTNNPDKVAGLEACGINVVERVEHKFPSNAHNEFYLRTKKKRSGHLL